MPIGIDRFEDADDVRDPPTSERVIHFLASHDDQAFTRREIADEIGADPETVGTNLTRLKDRGLVRHREPYWAITDDRGRVVSALRDRYDDAGITDILGTDDWTAWRDRGRSSGEGGPSESNHDAEQPSEADTTDAPRAATAPTTSKHREAAMDFFQRVRDRLDDAIDELYLFGSVARDAPTANSDVDVLAVVSGDADYASIDDQLLDIAYDVQLEHGVRVEVHSIEEDAFAARKERGDPFVRRVVEEGTTRV